MQIIRIENSVNGDGIFMNAKTLSKNYYKAYWFRRHQKMTCARHITGFKSGEHFCAYKSLEEMKSWVRPSEVKRFIKKGFVVLLLDIKKGIVHSDQVLYLKTDIKESKDISELFL